MNVCWELLDWESLLVDDRLREGLVETPCELLEWDTQFFACRIARIVGHQLDRVKARAVIDWCREERIDCLYFLADTDHPETTALAEGHGFGMKDVRLTYTLRLGAAHRTAATPAPDGIVLRPSRPEDIPALEALAQDSYTESRFYFDERFSRQAVSLMYKTWVRQSVLGQADVVLVVDAGGRAAGFITCHLLPDGQGQCRLGGLEPDLRGQGLGKYMYDGALRWFAQQGVETVVYVTQARNVRAQRLFQKLGFLTESVQIWYHKWFDRAIVERAPLRVA